MDAYKRERRREFLEKLKQAKIEETLAETSRIEVQDKDENEKDETKSAENLKTEEADEDIVKKQDSSS